MCSLLTILQPFQNRSRSYGVRNHLYLHATVLRTRCHPMAVGTRKIRTIPVTRSGRIPLARGPRVRYM